MGTFNFKAYSGSVAGWMENGIKRRKKRTDTDKKD